MSDNTMENVIEAAMALSRKERAQVAGRILDTLDNEDEQPVDQAAIDAAWGAEAERRYQAYLRGELKSVPIEQVLGKLNLAQERMKQRILEAAEIEIDEAIEYYARIEESLATRFESAVNQAIGDIMNHPLTWPRIWGEYRRHLLKGFTYGVIYRANEDRDEITIVAFPHLSRNPQYWTNRE